MDGSLRGGVIVSVALASSRRPEGATVGPYGGVAVMERRDTVAPRWESAASNY